MAKRLIDMGIVAALSVLLLPVMALVALAILHQLGRPVLFSQLRSGRSGVAFRLWKFRTMTDARDDQGTLLGDGARLTPFGRWLRSSSLDELPQIWNVLRGDMALVGPRPLLPEYDALYTAEQARRLEVRPGLTGWAQVNGRNAIGWDERFALDRWYVDHAGPSIDIKILWLTLMKVVRRDGIHANDAATMPRFTGSVEPDLTAQP